MRVALITANIGQFDNFDFDKFSTLQDPNRLPIDRYYFTEENLPYPLPNLNDRLKSKYVKIMTHRFLPNYDAYIWIDSSVDIIDGEFLAYVLNGLEQSEIVISKHHERDNAYDELDYILNNIADGKKYLSDRYADQPIEQEKRFYESYGLPKDYPLFITRFFARKNNWLLNLAFEDWWMRVLEFAAFDQSMFSHIAYKHNMNICPLDYEGTVSKFLKVNKHPEKDAKI